MKKLLHIIFLLVLIPFLAGLPGLLFLPVTPLLAGLLLFLWRKKIDPAFAARVYGIWLTALLLCFTVLMILGNGATGGAIVTGFAWALFPLFPLLIYALLMEEYLFLYLAGIGTYLVPFLISYILARKSLHKKWLLIPSCVLAAAICINGYLYINQPAIKYGGHGFDYMNGYSSTDFSEYQLAGNDSGLATLPETASFRIEKEEDMPILDGAEACYPLYAAIAKAVYADIGAIEATADKEATETRNGKIVTFTNTVRAYQRLIFEEDENSIDLFFGAMPSVEQLEEAEKMGVELEITPIGKEAFVFFVEEENPVSDVTPEQLRSIYHGDITNWKDLGGNNQEILAFQRPANSGSQTMMEYFMGDVTLKEPQTYETVSSMEGIIRNVAQYANEEGALGYSFRYFIEELHQEDHVKLLQVDGIAPTTENIKNGTYPITAKLCVVTRKDNENPNVQKLIDFILSPEGQYLVEASGYAPIT